MCIHSQLNWLLDTPLCWSSLWNLYTLNHSNNKGAIKLKLALALNWLRLLLIPLNYKVHQHSVSNLFTLLANHVFGLYIRTHRTQYVHVSSSNMFNQSCVSFLYFQPITQESEWRWMEVWKSLVVKQQCYVAMSQKCSFVHGTQSMIS